MLARWQFILLNGLGVAALALVVANGVLFAANRSAQTALAQRQQYVQQSIALESLYGDLVRTLAEAGARGNDRQMLELLAAQGLNVTMTPPEAAASSARRDGAGSGVAAAPKR